MGEEDRGVVTMTQKEEACEKGGYVSARGSQRPIPPFGVCQGVRSGRGAG
jgi:hypothetical protein